MRSRFAALLLLLLLLAPTVLGHIQGARPILQRGQRERTVHVEPGALEIETTLTIGTDPLRNVITHFVDPPVGVFRVEHRADASQPEDETFGEWRFERLVEYRDQNVDGFYQPAVDTAVRSWSLTHYQWQRGPVQRAQVSDVVGSDIVWNGSLTGGPRQRVDVFFAGKDFTDEGALVRPQDLILYYDFMDMPVRGLGHLYAIEVTVRTPADATLALFSAENTSTALTADRGLVRSLLVWGGEALLDEREQRIAATLEDERVDGANRTARLVLHLPTADASMRFVMVSGVEYLVENLRAPMPFALVVLAVAFAAFWPRKSGRSER